MKIGVISDTHGHFDPAVCELFAGAGHILHGGDVGHPSVLLELESIAPVTAVLGNADDAHTGLKLTETLRLADRTFLLHHIVNPMALGDYINDRIAETQPDVVVFGHTHKPFCQKIGGVLYLNPGYAGKPKLGQERSVAILHCDQHGISYEFVSLRP